MNSVRTAAEPVPLRGIAGALQRLWRVCCGAGDDDSLSRALTMNLIAAAESDQSDALRATLEKLVHRLPCRAFLVHIEPGAGDRQARVSGGVRSQGRNREIVLEQIELPAEPGGFAAVAGGVRPLRVGGIPTHLVWGGRLPAALADLERLLELCDHAVVDSSRFVDPAADLDAVAAVAHRAGPPTDLNWLRLRPWRRALAQAFEHFTWRPEVPTLVAVRHGPGTAAAGVLLGRWLERRLGARVELSASGAGADQIELVHGPTRVSVLANADRLAVAVSLPDRCVLPFHVPASRGACADLLAAAIDMA